MPIVQLLHRKIRGGKFAIPLRNRMLKYPPPPPPNRVKRKAGVFSDCSLYCLQKKPITNPHFCQKKAEVPRVHNEHWRKVRNTPSEVLLVQDKTSVVSKHNTEIVNHFQIVKYTL